jgi:hypothetical protein
VSDATQGSAQQDSRPPRGALVVVAVGLVACVVAALASVGKGEGEAANLEWVQNRSVGDSLTLPTPGSGGGEMSLINTTIHATGTNVSGYSLFDAGSTLKVSAGSPIGGSRILCSVKAKHGTEIAQSSGGLRATYPRSSEDGIYSQAVPETVLMDFSSHSSELALLEVPDRPKGFTTEQGIKVGWPEYQVGIERIKYYVAGKPKTDLELPFFTIWKTTAPPEASISCALTTSAGTKSVQTQIALAKNSPPIDEEAEAEKAEEREEAEEQKQAEEG